MSDPAGPDYDLSCWYLNRRRVMALTNAESVFVNFGSPDAATAHLRELAATAGLERALGDWLDRARPPTLGQLIAADKLEVGSFFTHFGDFYSRGVPAMHTAVQERRIPAPQALIHAKLDALRPGLKLEVRFSHEHFTANSSWTELRRRAQLLVVGAVTAIRGDVVEALPWAIATPFVSWMDGTRSLVGASWHNRLELHPSQIDAFEQIRQVPRASTRAALAPLRDIREADVKQAFAELIGEGEIPKDWGGEQSDLFTSTLTVDGQPFAAAFAFKGPAKFNPMTFADLGKNGDQIVRLYAEPADILVLQHCHVITTPVRAMMRAFAQQFGNLRTCCIIDGYDTLRILKTYRKCGLTPDERTITEGSSENGGRTRART
jgi:hypothetical protein